MTDPKVKYYPWTFKNIKMYSKIHLLVKKCVKYTFAYYYYLFM